LAKRRHKKTPLQKRNKERAKIMKRRAFGSKQRKSVGRSKVGLPCAWQKTKMEKEGKKKMKLLKKTVPLWALLLVAIMSASAVVATVVITQQINTQIQILAAYGMEVYGTDQTTLLTSVDFGVHHRGDQFYSTAEPQYYYIKNIGEADIWISFNVIDWIDDIQISVEGTGSPNIWSGGVAVPDELSTTPLTPGQTLTFRFRIIIEPTAPFGTYTPKITFNAHDGASG
jgi:hypothetical protein